MLRLFQQLGSLPLLGLSNSTLNPNKLVAVGCGLQKKHGGEEGVFVESHQNDIVSVIFLKKKILI
jgi:hypothetical protein